jgi:hypothetical protein
MVNRLVFPVYRSGFPVYRSIIQNFSKFDFFNCNRPVFGEPKKPDRTGFVGFCITEWFLSIFESMIITLLSGDMKQKCYIK